MGPNYSLVKSAHMGQIRLLVFARNNICAAISRIDRGTQATGVAGVATNKGGVAVGIKLWDTEICFINAHMVRQRHPSGASGTLLTHKHTRAHTHTHSHSHTHTHTHCIEQAAHQDKVKQRNKNYTDIIKGLRINPDYPMDCLTGYHHVFWVGDLNYRLDFGQQVSGHRSRVR